MSRHHPQLPPYLPPGAVGCLREGERGATRSPVNFREGRRSSDGLVAQQGIVAFQQRLYDKDKAEEVVNLHQVRQEARVLASKYGEEDEGARRGGAKRPSLPESLCCPGPRQVMVMVGEV